jgi:SAM-dependent methyltransferase
MSIRCDSKDEFLALSNAVLTPLRSIVEPHFLSAAAFDGYCSVCRARMTYDLGPVVERPDWRNLREGLVCSTCGLNSRMRMIIRVVDEVLASGRFRNAVVLERLTPLYDHLLARIPGLIGCEFVSEQSPGETFVLQGKPTRNENMMDLTFEAGTLDLLMHFDVLEHVPDAATGLKEAFRVLSPNGIMIFTCPFFHQLERNIVRSRLLADGSVEHLMEKGYHGNPLSAEGSLVYFHPSLELFDMLDDAGFDRVQTVTLYDPVEGIVSNGCPYPEGDMWPVTFVARKS